MKRNNLIWSIAAGAAILSAAYYINKRGGINFRSLANDANDLIDGMKNRISADGSYDDINDSAHDGQHLADKIRHKVEHKMAMARKS